MHSGVEIADSKHDNFVAGTPAMNRRIKELRDLVVALDRADRNLAPMTPEAYRDAALRAQKMTRDEMGLLPEAVCNYLLRLGWGHGDKEIVGRDEAIALFDLADVGKSPSRFDTK